MLNAKKFQRVKKVSNEEKELKTPTHAIYVPMQTSLCYCIKQGVSRLLISNLLQSKETRKLHQTRLSFDILII